MDPTVPVTWTGADLVSVDSLLASSDGGHIVDSIGRRILLGNGFVLGADTSASWISGAGQTAIYATGTNADSGVWLAGS